MNLYLYLYLSISLIYTFSIYFDQSNFITKYKFTILSFITFILIILIGPRDIVGSDFGGYYLDYIYMTDAYAEKDYFKSTSLDLLYEMLSHLTVYLGLSFTYLSLLFGIIFTTGVVFFANKEKDYLLIILIFLSCHFLVLGMGYIRQGLSLAFIFLLIDAWRNNKTLKSYIFLILAILSHKFAILYFFLIIVRPKGKWFFFNKYLYLILLIFCIIIAAIVFSNHNIVYYFSLYSKEYSMGAYYRFLLFVICTFLFFKNKSFFYKRTDYRYLFLSANIIIFLIPFIFIFSTMVDRITIYLIPFIYIILSNIGFTSKIISTNLIRSLIVFLMFIHLFLWTNFSSQAHLYVPYKMIYPPNGLMPHDIYMRRICCY